MTQPVVAVEPNGRNAANFRPTEAGGAQAAAPGARFTYPSGSQPLEGFTIKRGVGHGGFGEVYYAVSDGGKDVALKLIRRNLDVELRGIRHCLNLKHPNLLAIYDIRRDDHGDNWVVMEFVTGQCLEEVIAAHPSGLPREQAVSWFFGIAAGVACLHDHGIVHRDLKPGNIFCDEGMVKLGDYGLSKFISCSRRSGQTESVGTVHYMAPEIANGRYGKEIDVYALGIILYEILTGRVPFEGESVGEVLMKHLTTPPDVSMLAEPFRGVVARALEKDPAKRFASVAEMLAALPQPAESKTHFGPLPSAAGGQDKEPAASQKWGFARSLADGVGNIEQEPVFRAARQVWRRGYDAWNASPLNTPTKIVLLAVVGVMLVVSAPGLFPLAGMLLLAYACYFTIRAVVLAHQARHPQTTGLPVSPPQPAPSAAAAPQPASPAPAAAAQPQTFAPERNPKWRHRRAARRELALEALVLKSPRERATELIGSLVGGGVVAATMALVVLVLYGFRSNGGSPELWASTWWTQYMWLVLVSVAGTWAVLVPAKFWEGSRGDVMLRRFIFMVLGLGVGLVAFGGAAFLAVDLPTDSSLHTFHFQRPRMLLAADALSNVKYHLAAFATLFALLRWWRQADPLRSTRLSLWSLAVCGLLAMLFADFWGFPQPWLPMAACAISVSVQLASPWMNPYQLRPRSVVEQ